MDNSNQLSRLDNAKIVEIISKIPNLTDKDRHDLSLKIASDDVEIRRQAFEKMTQSQIAHYDFVTIMGELTAMNKQGVYVKSKQTIKTGSGTFEIEVKGGDKSLIVPVLIIVGIVVIAALLIVFSK